MTEPTPDTGREPLHWRLVRDWRLLWNILGALLALWMVVSATAAWGADWSSCQDDLDRLRRASRDASDIAERVQSYHDDLESKASDLRSKVEDVRSAASWLQLCRSRSRDCFLERSRYDSAVSDHESAKSSYEYARSAFESERSNLESELSTISSRIRSVEASCEYDLGSGRVTTSRGSAGDRLCMLLRRLKGRMSDQSLMDTCMKSKTAEECKRCLE